MQKCFKRDAIEAKMEGNSPYLSAVCGPWSDQFSASVKPYSISETTTKATALYGVILERAAWQKWHRSPCFTNSHCFAIIEMQVDLGDSLGKVFEEGWQLCSKSSFEHASCLLLVFPRSKRGNVTSGILIIVAHDTVR